MFIVNDKLVYQITRKSAIEGLGFAIEEKLKAQYNEIVLKAVVNEILQHVEFPIVMDSNDVYIYHNEKFMKYVLATSGIQETAEQYEISYFKPRYNGPEVRQIFDVLEYSMEQLLFRQDHYKNAMIVQSDDDQYGVVSMLADVKNAIVKKISNFLSENESKNIANNIIEYFYSDSMLIAGLRQNGDMTYYSLGTDNACKRLSIFDASELYKAIMSFLPDLKVISAKAKMAAIYLHNYILYGYEFQGSELRNPCGFRGKKAIFKRTVRGIDFYLHPKRKIWVSDYIKIKANEIDFTFDKRLEGIAADYYRGRYKGFYFFWHIDDDMPMPSDNLPVILDGSKYVYYVSKTFGFHTFDRALGDSDKHFDSDHKYNEDNFEAYIRIELN